jgi:hypothetical protein
MSLEVAVPIAFGIIAAVLTIICAWRWRGDKYLCDNCCFNNDNDCKKLERPCETICMSYRKQT